jgi:hypothetical protein
MRNLFIMLFLTLSVICQAQAHQLKIHKADGDRLSLDKISFATNADLNRVWTQIELVDARYNSENYETYIRGLVYNNLTRKIYYLTDSGKKILCAETNSRGTGIYKKEVVVLSENCYFSHEYSLETIEDGNRSYRKNILNIYLNIIE